MLRCLGMPPPQPTAILARAVAARAALRSYQPKRNSQSRGARSLTVNLTDGGGAREEVLPTRGRAVERAFWTGLAALSSQGCMRGAPVRWGGHGPCVDDARHDCVLRAVSSAVVLRGGDRAEWPVGAKQSTHVRACQSHRYVASLISSQSLPRRPHHPVSPTTTTIPPPPPPPPTAPPSPLSPSYGLPTSPPYQHYTTTSSTPVTATSLRPHGSIGAQVDVLVSNTTDAISCLASRFEHTRVASLPPAQLRLDVMSSPWSPLNRCPTRPLTASSPPPPLP